MFFRQNPSFRPLVAFKAPRFSLKSSNLPPPPRIPRGTCTFYALRAAESLSLDFGGFADFADFGGFRGFRGFGRFG